MKLRKLEIGAFKNLRDFSIDFSQQLTTVLLGRNGTGKSNLLEALIIIFRDLDLGVSPAFRYILHYECRDNEIYIDADPARQRRRGQDQVSIRIRNPGEMESVISYTQFHSDPNRIYLPSYVFGYYSGPSNRMEKHFDIHQNRFYQDQLKGKNDQRRPLFYARSIQSQFALLAFFMDEDLDGQSAQQFLYEVLGIEKLISVLFVLHKPSWSSKEGDPRFWNARGVLGQFISYLYEIALAPMKLMKHIKPEFASNTNLEHFYFFLRNEQDLKKLFAYYRDGKEFFNALESTYISKILSEVRIRLKRHDTEDTLTFNDLSEGEQQLLMVLGLLRFTKAEEALFLLDEPDTHLNPTWSVQYLEFMQWVVGDQPSSQVIMTTHNPLVIAGLERNDVRIMQRDNEHGRIFVEVPRENPRGMGVAGILTSELFGLRSALDLFTQRRLDEQRVLAAKEQLTQSEQHDLATLTSELDELGFMSMEDDPLYHAFITRFIKREDPVIRDQVALTPEQQEQRINLVDEIINELIAEGRW